MARRVAARLLRKRLRCIEAAMILKNLFFALSPLLKLDFLYFHFQMILSFPIFGLFFLLDFVAVVRVR